MTALATKKEVAIFVAIGLLAQLSLWSFLFRWYW